jgi:hypothetical protein
MRSIAALILIAALAACASTPSVYAPAAGPDRPGFSETRIESDRYRVSYRGTGGDRGARVGDLALLRAAELTLANGYDWFAVTNRFDEARAGGGSPSVSVGVGGGSWGRHSGGGVGVGVGFPIGGGESASLAQSTLEVRFGRGAKPADADAYDAREVQSTIRARM